MAKAMVAVEIPDGWELACDEMRVPHYGDHYLAAGGIGFAVPGGAVSCFPRVIVRRVWQWPAWLKAEWLFCGPSGKWYASNARPSGRIDGPEGYGLGWVCGGHTILIGNLIGFDPPPCDDWRKSLRRNPAIEDEQAF